MNAVMPKWIDEVSGVDFTPEKEILADIERWADADGWHVSDGGSLPTELRQRTDVLLEAPSTVQKLRIVVLPKSKGSPGSIRIDASTHRIFELVYQPRRKQWRVEIANLPLADDLRKQGWAWLKDLAFRK